MTSHWSERVPWIWTPNWDDTSRVARLVQFRRTFTLETVPSQCLVRISADTRYRLFVNGYRVSFGPAKSHLGEWNYETVDIAPWCHVGRNIVAVRVLRYSLQHSGNLSMARAPIPGFILHTDDLDISTDTRWRCKVDNATQILSIEQSNPSLGPPLLLVNEAVDGGQEDRGWLTETYDDTHWESAVPSSMKRPMLPVLEPWRLVERTIPAMEEIPTTFTTAVKASSQQDQDAWQQLLTNQQPVQIPPQSTMTVVLDASALTTGFLQLRMRGGASTHVKIRCAECFERPPDPKNPNPFARNKGDRIDTSGVLLGMDDFYTIDASLLIDQEVVYEPFWFRTFRYVELQIETATMPLEILQFDHRETHYPLDVLTQFTTFPSPSVAQQWAISCRTLRNCMHETYEDCPYYEQNQFAMDSRLQILFTYQLSNDARLAEKCIQEFYASRGADGLLETHFPSPFAGVKIPFFSLYWILMVHDHMYYRSDPRLVRRYIGTIDGILDHFAQRIAPNGLVGRLAWDVWPFVDWTREWAVPEPGGDFRSLARPPAYHRTGQITYSSLLYAYVLNQAAELCTYIGRYDTASEYRDRAEQLNQAVRTHCLRDGILLVDGPDSPAHERSQHTHVFAVLSGALQGDVARESLRVALTDPSFVRCSYAMSFYVLAAARVTGLYETLRSSLLAPWSDMMRLNLTTWAESEAMPRSDCHGWSAVPIYDFVANVVGIAPGRPGFEIIRFRPLRVFWPEMDGTFAVGGGVVKVTWRPGEPVRFMADFDTKVEVEVKGVKEVKEVMRGETLTLDIQ